jgi:hypothetical protein
MHNSTDAITLMAFTLGFYLGLGPKWWCTDLFVLIFFFIVFYTLIVYIVICVSVVL